eukprot:TRINITY_DN91709_c0_g1_i1.p1 TRINITY_DN91709_c0_g1~~TRINITY_DN91709_c0_g1_i1.p1  ORF type:complete len:564 (-),score=244.91 TRINITY_DN91709_c0_g1_i1:95-1786(-)
MVKLSARFLGCAALASQAVAISSTEGHRHHRHVGVRGRFFSHHDEESKPSSNATHATHAVHAVTESSSSRPAAAAETSSVDRAVAALRGRIGMLAAENAKLEEEVRHKASDNEKATLERRLAQSQAKEEAAAKHALDERSSMEKRLRSEDEKIEHLRQQVAEEKTALDTEKAHNKKELSQGLGLLNATEALNSKMATMEKDFAKKMSDAEQQKSAELGALKAAFEKKSEETRAKVEAEKAAAQKNLLEATSEVTAERKTNKELKEQVQRLEKEDAALQPELKQLQTTLASDRDSLKKMHDTSEQLKKDNAAFKSNIDGFGAKQAAADKERDALRQELAALRPKAQELDAKKAKTKQMHDEANELTAQLTGLKETKEQFRMKLEDYQKQNAQLNETLQRTNADNAALERRLRDTKSSDASDRKASETELAGLRAKAAQLDKMREERDSLQQQLENLRLKVKQSDDTMTLFGVAGNKEAEEVVKEALKDYISKQEHQQDGAAAATTAQPQVQEAELSTDLQTLAGDTKDAESSLQRLATSAEQEDAQEAAAAAVQEDDASSSDDQ